MPAPFACLVRMPREQQQHGYFDQERNSADQRYFKRPEARQALHNLRQPQRESPVRAQNTEVSKSQQDNARMPDNFRNPNRGRLASAFSRQLACNPRTLFGG